MKLKFYILAFCLLSMTNAVFSQTPEESFEKANNYYIAGNYEQAIESYRAIIDDGYQSAELFYNLGNSYFRMEKIPSAILYFERAARLAPSDSDIEFNLKIANLRIVDKFETVPKLFIVEWYESILGFLYSGVWGWVSVILLWASLLFLALFIISGTTFRKKFLFLLVVLGFIGTVLTSIIAYNAYYNETSREFAIIFSTSIYVKSAPDESSVDLLILHEGTKVEITDKLEGWSEILLENGNKGWVPASVLEVI
ncbi:MAG: tetratricopeptide repeat protein [Candidatus Kapabacteria bacterium]|nr:tetratricopeptide repeat protein [Candidatus Kapabacteria bacterium]